MLATLQPYVPLPAVEKLNKILNKYPFQLKITKGRKTKRGDFRATKPIPTITINNNLSKEQFLITLVHEIAHLYTYTHYPNAKPHGTEWKQCFQELMLPFLTTSIFGDAILRPLAKHLINPKATTDADLKLTLALQAKNFGNTDQNYFIFDLEPGTFFTFHNKTYQLLNKRRTRYECLEINSKKRYLIAGSAAVQKVIN